VTIADSVGTGLYATGATLFFVQIVGLSPAELSRGLALGGVVGFFSSAPIGMLADRLGVKRMLIALQLWLAACFTLLAFVNNAVTFTLACALLFVAERSNSPMIQAVVTVLMQGRDQVTTMAKLRSIRNVGYTVGALLATPLLSFHSRWAGKAILLGNGASFVLAALLLSAIPVVGGEMARQPARRLRFLTGFGDRRFLAMTVLNGILALHMTMLSVALPLWIAKATRAPIVLVPTLIAVNTVLAVALQVRFARGAEGPGRSRITFVRAAAALGGCCLLMAAAGSVGQTAAIALLAGAAVLLTAGELWQSVVGWQLPFNYAPEERTAEYLAIFSMGVTAQSILGPMLIVAVVELRTPGWLALATLFCVTAVIAVPLLPVARETSVPKADVTA
jgi:MFS family permease